MGYNAVSASIGGPEPGGAHSAERLRAMSRSAYQAYQATRYDDTGRVLPALIREAEAASRAAGLDDPAMCAVRALVYDTAAALLNRVGETALAWAAADRAIAAAEQSGQPVLVAASAWRLSYVIGGRRHPAQALDLAMAAAGALERTMREPDADTLSVYGALHLAAATAAAAVYDRAMTASLLGKAREIADRTGHGNRMGTAFGPRTSPSMPSPRPSNLGMQRRRSKPAKRSTSRRCPPAVRVGARNSTSIWLVPTRCAGKMPPRSTCCWSPSN